MSSFVFDDWIRGNALEAVRDILIKHGFTAEDQLNLQSLQFPVMIAEISRVHPESIEKVIRSIQQLSSNDDIPIFHALGTRSSILCLSDCVISRFSTTLQIVIPFPHQIHREQRSVDSSSLKDLIRRELMPVIQRIDGVEQRIGERLSIVEHSNDEMRRWNMNSLHAAPRRSVANDCGSSSLSVHDHDDHHHLDVDQCDVAMSVPDSSSNSNHFSSNDEPSAIGM